MLDAVNGSASSGSSNRLAASLPKLNCTSELNIAMPHTLLSLPHEILQRICKYVGDVHRPSLLTLALANKHLHSIANALLFETVTFNITTPARLRKHTRKCTALLQRYDALRYVRYMVLVGFDTKGYYMQGPEHGEDDTLFDFHRWQLAPIPSVDWDVNHQRLQGIPDYADFTWNARADKKPVQAAYDTDTSWAPLAELVRLLPGLTDLVYECPAQFPPCLLRALHDKTRSHRPHLHLRTFKLRMLGNDGSAAGATIIDPHELALIASPCLHSVWLQDHNGRTEFQGATHIRLGRQAQALEQIMKTEGLAPNLREVRVMQIPTLPSANYPGPRTWLPEELGGRNRKKAAIALEHLELGCSSTLHHVTDVDVEYWNGLANMSTLQELHLTKPVDERGLDELQSLRFPALTALTFHCVKFPNACYMDKVKGFIRSQSRLETLHMMTWDWSVSSLTDDPNGSSDSGTAGHHRANTTLRTLHLGYSMNLPLSRARPGILSRFYMASALEFTRLGAFYPRVEHLSLVIRRSKSDCHEVARYKALGASFPRLKRLALTMDASPPGAVWPPPDVWSRPVPRPENTTDSFENHYTPVRPYTNGHVMDVMVNSALDARLARQIFEAIGSPNLETMMIRVKGGTDFLPHAQGPDGRPVGQMPGLALIPWLNGLAREWVVERVCPEADLKVKEIGKNAEGWVHEGCDPLWVSDQDPFVKHFRTLWPETKSGSKGWFDDWESWPLYRSADGIPNSPATVVGHSQ